MGHGFLHICRYRTHHDTKEIIMSPAKRYAKKQAKTRQRRRRNAQERLERDRRQAQQAAEALHQALEELGLPDNLLTVRPYFKAVQQKPCKASYTCLTRSPKRPECAVGGHSEASDAHTSVQ